KLDLEVEVGVDLAHGTLLVALIRRVEMPERRGKPGGARRSRPSMRSADLLAIVLVTLAIHLQHLHSPRARADKA
ncbi:MAG: hypothetical protein WD099_04235, partial [Dongiaceae bacterium]